MAVPSLLLALLMVKNIGAVVCPIVSFNPDWNKIFKGESINMTCNVDPTVEDVTYHWFKDGDWVQSGKTYSITSAQESNTGNYHCQTSTGDKSDSARLEVYNGYIILQASPYVYEGDNLTLRCHHYPGYVAKQTIFYRSNVVIRDWGSEDELYIKNVDVTSSSKYKCIKEVYHDLLYYQPTDEISVSVQELFSPPTIRMNALSVREGDDVTLTCHTQLSLLRQATVLQFAFYRDGQNIREFDSSNNYDIPSVRQNDSGNYTCDVRASNYTMKKRSPIFTIQVRSNSEHGTCHLATAVLVTSLVFILILIGAGLIFLYRIRYVRPFNNQQPSKEESEESDDETKNIYTDRDTNNRQQNSSQNPHHGHGTDLPTDNLFIVC